MKTAPLSAFAPRARPFSPFAFPPRQLALVRIEMHGGRQGRATGWHHWAGYTLAHLSDGTQRTFPEDTGTVGILAQLEASGVCVENFQRASVCGELARSYPPRPTYATHFQHHYGNEIPVTVHGWQWSSTFGRWSALVTFADGWRGYTYPQITEANRRTAAGLAVLWIEENTRGLLAAGVPVELAMAEAEKHFARPDVRTY